jgi:hypothetical protein
MRRTKTVVAGSGIAAAVAIAGVLAGPASPAAASTRLGGVDMQRACSVQWANYGPTTAIVLDQHNAYSWACRSNYTHYILGGVDVTQECVLQYGSGAYAGLGSSTDPYSWYCQR